METREMRVKIVLRSIGYSLIEMLVYFIPVAIMIIAMLATDGTLEQIIKLPEWWFLAVFLLLDALRDSFHLPPDNAAEGSDLRAWSTLILVPIILSMCFLVLSIVDQRKPNILKIEDWQLIFEWLVLIFAFVITWVVKGVSIFRKLSSPNV